MSLLPKLLIVVSLVALLTAACGDDPTPTPTATVTSTPVPPTATPTEAMEPSGTMEPDGTMEPGGIMEPGGTMEPEPTATATAAPTATSVPTATPTPTAPPVATAMPMPGGEMVVMLTPSKDNTLYETSNGAFSNGAGSYIFAGTTASGVVRRAVLSFDMASQVPAGATITQLTLTMQMNRPRGGNSDVALHRLLADWGEGTSAASANEGGGVASSTGDATWIHRSFSDQNWQTPGGDFSPTPSGTRLVSGIGSYTWNSTAQMASDVQACLDDGSANFGGGCDQR